MTSDLNNVNILNSIQEYAQGKLTLTRVGGEVNAFFAKIP